MISKVASNVDKQSIPSNKVTAVRINSKTSWKAGRRRTRYLWETTIQVELPATGLPNIIRFRFCRYPGTVKKDYTGHFSYPVHPGMAGREVWVTLAHSFISGGTMPVGIYLDHDGASPIVLDGRQIKAS
tara:strand:+ start:368 stop:754 length:387 start_codon:yes stop_codon:yes gene_type:complete